MSNNSTKWRSRYKRADTTDKKPLRLSETDIEMLNWFSPLNFTYLTADLIAALVDRSLNQVQHRLRKLWDHRFIERLPPQRNPFHSGSEKIVYYLDKKGADALSEYLQDLIKPPKVDRESYQLQLSHKLLTTWFITLIIIATRKRDGVVLRYRYNDREFSHKVKIGDRVEAVVPDSVFGIDRSKKPTRNFFLEVQRATRKTKESELTRDQRKTVSAKFQRYYHFYKNGEYKNISRDEYPEMKNHKAMRVLVLTDVGDQEHENLIELARSVDTRGDGLRLFWFARASDFDLQNPGSVFSNVWRTPNIEDEQENVREGLIS